MYGCTRTKAAPPVATTDTANEALHVDRVSAATLRTCARFPGLTPVGESCTFAQDAHPPPFDVCRDFAAASNLTLPLVTVMVTHEKVPALDIASLYFLPPTASPAEAPTLVPLASAPERKVAVSSRGMMMAGVLEWGTLPSAGGEHVLAVVIDQVLHDYPLSTADMQALHDVDLAKTIECLDGAVFE